AAAARFSHWVTDCKTFRNARQEGTGHPRGGPISPSRFKPLSLQIVVQTEFCRVRYLLHRPGLLALAPHPNLQELPGEDPALQQKLMVGLQGVQGLIEALGQRLDLLLLLRREMV